MTDDKAPSTDELTDMQRLFCHEYVKDFNGKEAAIRAKFAPDHAGQQAWQMLQKPHIKNYIEDLQKVMLRKVNITAERVVSELAKIAFADLGQFLDGDGQLKAMKDLTSDQTAAMQELIVDNFEGTEHTPARTKRKLKLSDKQTALIALARHLGMFKDQMHLTTDGFVINIKK